ncbi:MAG: hypothetical protein ACTHMG_03405 [Sphingomonas sp.]
MPEHHARPEELHRRERLPPRPPASPDYMLIGLIIVLLVLFAIGVVAALLE